MESGVLRGGNSTMPGPTEQDQSSRIPADVVFELERLRSQVAELTGENALHSWMHSSRTEVGSELHQVQVELKELRQGAGRVESACVSDIKSHHS